MISNRIGRAMAVVTRLCARWPRTTVAVATVIAVCGLLYAWRDLGFVTSPYRLLPQDARYVILLQQHLREFGELNDIVVAVASAEPETMKAFTVRLADELARAGVGGRMTYRVETASLEHNALLYLSRAELTALRDRLFDYEDFLRTYAAHPTVVRLLENVNEQIANSMALGWLDLGLGPGRHADLRFVDAILDQLSARLDGKVTYVSPWSVALSGDGVGGTDAGWFFSPDRRLLFMFIEANAVEGAFTDNGERIALIRATIARLRRDVPGVEAGVTGSPAISNDEMVTAFRDSARAGVLSALLTLGLVLVAFRGVVKPLLMLATLALGLAWSMGAITLVVGQLNVFSVMFVSIVVGLGIDYGIYVLYRYQDERVRGLSLDRALWVTSSRTGPGILLGAVTAAGTFFVLRFTDFSGIGEFGVVSAIAVLASFVSMMTVFPALLVLVDRRRPGRRILAIPLAPPHEAEASWLVRLTARPVPVLTLAGVCTVLATWGALGVGFDDNLLHLQAVGAESVAWEERTLATVGRSGVTAITTASTLPELQRKHEAFARLASVARVESLLTLVPDHQAEKMAMIRQLAPLVAPIQLGTPEPVRSTSLRAPLEMLKRRLGIILPAVDDERDRRNVEQTRAKVDGVLQRLGGSDVAMAGSRVDRLQNELFHDFAERLQRFQRSLAPHDVSVADIPPSLRRGFVGASGHYLIRIFPAVDIWEREGATRFVGDVRTVDADVTGAPITSYEAIRFIRRGYVQGTLYAFALVTVLAAAILRSAAGTVLALTTLVLGVVWMLGLMRVFGLSFNLANVWALPLIIGAAVEYAANIYVRAVEGSPPAAMRLPRSAVRAVILNGLTTIAGFGSLMVAQHRGIWSLGLLLTIGAAVSLVASLGVLPALMRIGARRAWSQGTTAAPTTPMSPRSDDEMGRSARARGM
jgi:uncharacterized protein